MRIEPLELEGLYLVTSELRSDERGYFVRSYERAAFADAGLVTEWEQESISFNKLKNTVRGLHFQHPPHPETKLVRVAAGLMVDVAVDLRKASPTYGKWLSVELSAENAKALYIPAGFAHGFQTLTDDVVIAYKIDVPYHADLAGGVRWNDPAIGIDWLAGDHIISGRDKSLPTLDEFDSPF